MDWSSVYNWPALCEALETRRAERHLPAADKDSELSIEAGCIPRTTLNSVEKRLGDLPITRENCFASLGGLLSLKNRQLLQDMIVNRDRMNTGMDRKECIQNISEMTSTTHEVGEEHFKHLVRTQQLPRLKRFGRVVKAQPTTTKRSQITVQQQFRWHTLIDSVWDRMRTTNLPTDKFESLIEHFQLNLDETCVMANDGTLHIVAGHRSKTEKRSDDSRLSLTAIRIGNAGGSEGPWIFLYKGKAHQYRSLSDKNLVSRHGAPVGSTCHPSPNAYLTDAVWLELAPIIAKGIREMPVIRNHPDWWVTLSLDGYGSHMNLASANQIFTDHLIWIVKEEADSS